MSGSFGAGGSGGSSSGQAGTGTTSSLSFIPALLGNAFFGSGIGLDRGGFSITGEGDFRNGNLRGKRASSLVDPFGLSGGLTDRQSQDPFSSFFQSQGGDISGLPGGDSGGSSQGFLNPGDLVSNLTDLADPNSNPGITGGLQGLLGGQFGGQVGQNLLLGGIAPTFAEGLQTGFKPDLQPVIDEASRAFFSDIVPQLGQNNVALQEGVGPFSTDLSSSLVNAGGALASQLGSLEVQNQNLAGDRRNDLLGLSGLITDQLFNSSTNAGRNTLDLGEQLAQQGTLGGRQASLLSFLNQLMSGGPIQASSSSNQSKSGGGQFASSGGI